MGETSFKIMLLVFNLIFLAFLSGIIIFIRQYRLKKNAHEREMETIDVQHKEELLKTQVEIQAQTMRHIGREIHDNVGQKLTLSSLYLQQLVLEKKAPEVSETLQNINEIIDDSLSDLRRLSKSLTDDRVENNPIEVLLEAECDKIRDLRQYQVHFESCLREIAPSYLIKSVLLRITQEFLQNSIKHAQCTTIWVELLSSENDLEMHLKDDGRGFDIEKITPKGVGLQSIQKRIEMIGGSYHLESTSAGTSLTLKIPIA